MNATLTVDDPLVDQEVTILITLTAANQAHSERQALVSVGITGQPPVTKTGLFGQIATLIDQAWAAFGVQAQMVADQSVGHENMPASETTDTAVQPAKETKPQPDLSILF